MTDGQKKRGLVLRLFGAIVLLLVIVVAIWSISQSISPIVPLVISLVLFAMSIKSVKQGNHTLVERFMKI